MLDTHLSQEQVQRYQGYALAPDEIVAVYAHLEGCDACRALVASSVATSFSPSTLAADLLLETLHEPEHLSDTHLAELADGLLERADREIALNHLEICASCRTEAAQVQALRALLAASPREEFAPLSAAPVPLSNPANLLLSQVEGSILRETGKLPRALAERVRELLQEGLVTPIRSIQSALNLWRSANLPVAALRGQLAPIPLTPVATALRSTPLIVRWEGVPEVAAEYTLLLAHQKSGTERTLLWKQTLQNHTEIAVPEEIALQSGALYVWQVTATTSRASTRSVFAWFTLLSEKETEEMERAERLISDSALALAGLYERYGLYEEAQTQLQTLAESSLDSYETTQMLERLHTQRS